MHINLSSDNVDASIVLVAAASILNLSLLLVALGFPVCPKFRRVALIGGFVSFGLLLSAVVIMFEFSGSDEKQEYIDSEAHGKTRDMIRDLHAGSKPSESEPPEPTKAR